MRDYHGYADSTSSDKKIISDVWRRGDRFFRSGDVFVMDELGWLYFKVHNIYSNIYSNIYNIYISMCVWLQDRAGDTFRWKGENVSTMEVEAMISQVMINEVLVTCSTRQLQKKVM